MEISLLKALLSNISSFLNLSSFENINSEPVQKYYLIAEEILKLLKPIILNTIVDSEIVSDELLKMVFEGLGLSIEELRKQFESWQPLFSKVYFVLQVESLISKICNSSLDIFQLLKSSNQHLPDEGSSASLEHYLQKIKHVGYEQTSSVIREAIRDQADSVGPSSEVLVKIAESLSLSSNLEILIEVVALEKLNENAEQAEKTAEVEFFDQLIALVSRMHDHLVLIKQSQTRSPVVIPADFCCPLSLELMMDPVIVASGKTYEQVFIKKWIDLGLTVCPKTRQTLAHTNLIPNYTLKALIANWCEDSGIENRANISGIETQVKKLVEDIKSTSVDTQRADHMEISLFKALLGNISSFLNLSSFENINSEPVLKYYLRAEEILKLLKPIILNAIVDSDIISDESLNMVLEGLGLSIEELRKQFEKWQPLLSKVYFVLQVESLISKIRNSSLDIFQFLKSSNQHLPDEVTSASLEHWLQKIKHVGYEQTSSVIGEAIRDQADSVGPSSEVLVEIAESLSLSSILEILIEVVALEKLKKNAEQAEKNAEVEFLDQLIALVSCMHDHFVLIKQSQTCSPVVIPACFCCPLSLELMMDPVILASGQTYERAFIKKWIDLGLTVCPKTRRTLAHTNFIPNYTVRALIANWFEDSGIENRAELSGIGTQVKKLVEDLKSTSVDTQRKATAQLRLLAKQNMINRIIMADCGAISLLVDLLRSPDKKTKENAVTALLNSSVDENNRIAIANANAIEPLIHVLETGSPEAKENSAATLFSLSVIEDNKVKIGRSGAISPLVDLLQNGTPRGKKDAATALFSLSTLHENKSQIVQAGAVRHLVDLMDPAAGMIDKAAAVLANLAKIPEGRSAIGQEGGIPLLVEAVELGSVRGKKNATIALLQLCTNSTRFCCMVQREGAVPALVALSQSGTPRAKEKAQALLSCLRNQRHGYA